MTEDLKKLILKAADILQSYGATEVFFFGSVAKVADTEDRPIDLAVSGLPPEIFYQAMGSVLSAMKRRCNLVDLDEKNPYVDYLKSHGKLQPDLFSRIRNELQQLHQMLDRYGALIDKVRKAEPSPVEVIALAGVLQLLYSGIDKIFTLIAAGYGGGFRKGCSCAAEALERMVMPAPGRSAVISKVLMEQLRPYISFRQVFCYTYSYDLGWAKMRNLVLEAEEILLLFEAELNCFMENHAASG
ncbi:MAG: hypothetical protein JW913_14105 [Chitinispirillaceae bacterium]|nr:hypothetical protein [Chitinispirillaceae bacterium]